MMAHPLNGSTNTSRASRVFRGITKMASMASLKSRESSIAVSTDDESTLWFSSSDLSHPQGLCRQIPMSTEILIPKNFNASEMLVDFGSLDDSASSSCSSEADYMTGEEDSIGEDEFSPLPPTVVEEPINPFAKGFDFAIHSQPSTPKKTSKSVPDSPFKKISFYNKFERRNSNSSASSLRRGTLSPSRGLREENDRTESPFLPRSKLPNRRQSKFVKVPSVFLDDDDDNYKSPKDSLSDSANQVIGAQSDMMLEALQKIALEMTKHSKY